MMKMNTMTLEKAKDYLRGIEAIADHNRVIGVAYDEMRRKIDLQYNHVRNALVNEAYSAWRKANCIGSVDEWCDRMVTPYLPTVPIPCRKTLIDAGLLELVEKVPTVISALVWDENITEVVNLPWMTEPYVRHGGHVEKDIDTTYCVYRVNENLVAKLYAYVDMMERVFAD